MDSYKEALQKRLNSERVYTISDIQDFLNDIQVSEKNIVRRHKLDYYLIPASFDIETTSTYYEGEKVAFMYIWQLGINGLVIVGRTWDEFLKAMEIISDKLDLCIERRLAIYVHNLSFEFQFIRKLFKWSKVFAIKSRKVLRCVTEGGIEFRCSYLLSGMSLARLGDQLHEIPVKKMVGDLDYNLVRHSKTPLSDKELKYCTNDVKVVMSYIYEQIIGNVNIPYTSTGVVRNFVRNRARANNDRTVQNLTIEPEEFQLLRQAFQGGYTHLNYKFNGKVVKNVKPLDITSDYPYSMLLLYPMSKGKHLDVQSVSELLNASSVQKGVVCEIKFTNLLVKPEQVEGIISEGRSVITGQKIVNNGRVMYAESLRTWCTNIDFERYNKFYNWDECEIVDSYSYKMKPLPKYIIESIIKFYTDKTVLKGVKGKEKEYLAGKGMLNSIYGMSVTSPIRPEYKYSNTLGWLKPEEPDLEEALDKYNNDKGRFLFYPWGVFVTAYARARLWDAILECGEDFVYSDTDSVKLINYDKHKKYFDDENKRIIEKYPLYCLYYGSVFNKALTPEDFSPKTIKGESKPLGVWDDEGLYTRFKSIGAKRYLFEQDGELEVTIAGLPKKSALNFLMKGAKNNKTKAFNLFGNDMLVPKTNSGKLTSTYIDDEKNIVITDYLGNTLDIRVPSGLHLEPASFSMSMSEAYIRFLIAKGVIK